MTDPIEEAIEAGVEAFRQSYRERHWVGASVDLGPLGDLDAAIRAAAPILIQHGRELASIDIKAAGKVPQCGHHDHDLITWAAVKYARIARGESS